MTVIRISKQHWGKAFLKLIAVAPIHVTGKEMLIEVLPAHLELLGAQKIPFEIVPHQPRVGKRRHAKSN